MTQGTIHTGKPHGVLKWVLRFPIWLYRLRLGWLMSARFIMLTHTGRRSGLLRYAVIEVVHFDEIHNIYTVASGWGERSDWFQNILKTSSVSITTNKVSFSAQALRLSVNEGADKLRRYAQRYPASFRTLVKIMLGAQAVNNTLDVELLAKIIPVVSFIPDT